ncbi:hypothetical protein MARPO_0023s0145 [Marchantia polymorpha]|uniref:Uncharacterized protein n=1 Tax=Marchantia polymorpha TaxID=3197 RepID=A0A2R6XCV4_MARPO|nr:hypothetical protein MARPO_0023s0145 [Marchantia polymorpha]|eukprot:PTQ43849.1 hypothetical protein MARPO_0023s0145 [Marchantia polymorpha]
MYVYTSKDGRRWAKSKISLHLLNTLAEEKEATFCTERRFFLFFDFPRSRHLCELGREKGLSRKRGQDGLIGLLDCESH